MATDRWLIKFASDQPDRFDPTAHIPVFHRWIQQHRLPLVLIDVADYDHVPDGPGVLLVSHEYNIFADHFGGRPGLTVQRKLRGLAGSGSLVETLRTALLAVQALSTETSLAANRFRLDRVEIVANDRLRAPNSDEGWNAVEASVREAAQKLYGGAATVERVETDAAGRLTATVSGPAADAAALLDRLSS